jgi:large subunit ribosomal protein L4
VFGPKPRSFKQDLPKRVRRLAIRSALSAKAQEGSLKVISALDMDAPRTTVLKRALSIFEMERSALVVTGAPDRKVFLSARNLPGAKALPASYLNVVDLLSHRGLLMTVDAVRRAEALWGGERAKSRRPPSAGGVTGE